MPHNRYFGTDGIRGPAGEGLLTAAKQVEIGRAIGSLLARRKTLAPRPRVALGRDTRRSGSMIENALSAGLAAGGADVNSLGVCTTPALAWCTRTGPYDMGVMISASHNSFEDNGIKVFAHDGFKIPDRTEDAIQRAVEQGPKKRQRPRTGERIGTISADGSALEHYLDAAAAIFTQRRRARGLSVVFDGAEGGGFELGPALLQRLGVRATNVHCDPDGVNINRDCGALHPQRLGRRVKREKAKLGVTLDGDGDRVMFLDERGRLCDGDHVLALWARSLHQRGRLPGNLVVSTVMANVGLEASLREIGVRLLRTPVGDRHVAHAMRRRGALLGGEQSGHLLFFDGFQTTGDGLLTMLHVIEIMLETRKPLSQLAACMRKCPQALVNVRVREKPPLDDITEVRKACREATAALGDAGRVLLRYSGTEPLARVMVEGPEIGQVRHIAQGIADAVKRSIGK